MTPEQSIRRRDVVLAGASVRQADTAVHELDTLHSPFLLCLLANQGSFFKLTKAHAKARKHALNTQSRRSATHALATLIDMLDLVIGGEEVYLFSKVCKMIEIEFPSEYPLHAVVVNINYVSESWKYPATCNRT